MGEALEHTNTKVTSTEEPIFISIINALSSVTIVSFIEEK